MNPQMAMGLFALAVAGAALVRHLGGGVLEEKGGGIWERSLRRRLQFIGHVALPLVIGTIFLSYGIARVETFPPAQPGHHSFLTDHSRAYIDLLSRAKPDPAPLAWSELSFPPATPEH